MDELNSKLETTRVQLMANPYTFVLFKSPGGNGLKVVGEYDHPITNVERFKELHKHYGEALGEEYSIEVDNTHEAARACFMSSDPDIYVNPNHLLLQTDIVIAAQPRSRKNKERKDRKELLSILQSVSENRNASLVN